MTGSRDKDDKLISPIDVVYDQDSKKFITLDHRRVVAANVFGAKQRLFAVIHQSDSKLPVEQKRRFKRCWNMGGRG